MKLSILIPVYNEERTIGKLLYEICNLNINSIEREVIIIDDCSTDQTNIKIKEFLNRKYITLIRHRKNAGKGSAIQTGIGKATGDYIIIQDADLEYNPKDIPILIQAVVDGRAEIVYGTRLKRLPNFKRDERTLRFFVHYLGNKILSALTSLLYGQWITDMETGYKLMPLGVIKSLQLKSSGFEFEPEITAKILKRGYKIYEIPISTNPRGYKDGKKLNTIKDGFKALKTLFYYKFNN